MDSFNFADWAKIHCHNNCLLQLLSLNSLVEVTFGSSKIMYFVYLKVAQGNEREYSFKGKDRNGVHKYTLYFLEEK